MRIPYMEKLMGPMSGWSGLYGRVRKWVITLYYRRGIYSYKVEIKTPSNETVGKRINCTTAKLNRKAADVGGTRAQTKGQT